MCKYVCVCVSLVTSGVSSSKSWADTAGNTQELFVLFYHCVLVASCLFIKVLLDAVYARLFCAVHRTKSHYEVKECYTITGSSLCVWAGGLIGL